MIELVISGETLDLPKEGLNLGIVYQIANEDGLTGNSGSRSEYSFELPATKRNSQVFGYPEQAERVQDLSKKLLPCSIFINGVLFFEGTASLRSVALYGAASNLVARSYKVALFGSNASWSLELKTRPLVDFVGDIPAHTYNFNTVFDAVGNVYPTDSAAQPQGGNNPAADWGYMLIKWADWAISDRVQWQEYTPFIFVKSLALAIFQGLGYSVQSSFFETDFFSRLKLPVPFPDNLGGLYGEEYLNFSAEASNQTAGNLDFNIMDFPLNQIQPPQNPAIYSGGVYTAPVDGYYLFSINLAEIDVPSPSPDLYQIGISLTNAPTIFIRTNQLPAYNIRYEQVVRLSAGQTAFVQLSGLKNDPLDPFENVTAIYSGTLEIQGEAEIVSGLELDFKYLLNRDWQALEFIKGLAHLFNLRFETDNVTRSVTIEPADRYLYAQQVGEFTQLNNGFFTGETDRTNKVNLLQAGELSQPSQPPAEYRLSFKADSQDKTAEGLSNSDSLPILAASFSFDGTTKDGAEEIENPFFAATVSIFDASIMAEDSLVTPQFPVIWPASYLEERTAAQHLERTKYLPRILYGEPFGSGPRNGRINVLGAPLGVSDAPQNFLVNWNNTDGQFISLSFGNVTVNGNQIQGLLSRFYLSQLKRLELGRSLVCSMLWGRLELSRLSFREKIRIGNGLYLLQKIGPYNVLGQGLAKTTLIQIQQPEESDLDKVSAGPENKIYY